MSVNPYAPPSARVGDVDAPDAAPHLWNPNAAANWSLLFTAAFGAFLHMKNWEALGEPARAAASQRWVILALVLLAVAVSATYFVGGAARILTISTLIAWYYGSARAQAAFVRERFGSRYPRRGWLAPLLAAALLFLGVLGLVAGLNLLVAAGAHPG